MKRKKKNGAHIQIHILQTGINIITFYKLFNTVLLFARIVWPMARAHRIRTQTINGWPFI